MMYIYQPIAKPDKEIRVALLQPGVHNDDIHITFGQRILEVRQVFENIVLYTYISFIKDGDSEFRGPVVCVGLTR
jgi:hypothetical protein